jgi:general secretion pathway protein G
MRPEKNASGFTLIELLIVIAIIGILAAIAIPNLLNAVQRGKQKRTMADMKALATAIEAYQVDDSEYPAAACPGGSYTTPGPRLDDSSFSNLEPTYIAQPPWRDGWGKAFRYSLRADLAAYNLRSMGRDGNLDPASCGTTTDFDQDIIYSNGTFLQWPEGTQN